jgi:3,4-dehydroadipyl-CoA semialdehyde dehydrogenase
MTEQLENYWNGQWQGGRGPGTLLIDPVLGEVVAHVDSSGLDLGAGFAFARDRGGAALRALTYRQRGELLANIAKTLLAHRDAYFDIATRNSGTVKNDSAIDIDGALYTINTYAKLAATLGDRAFLLDGEATSLAKDGVFRSQHVQIPTRGLALLINAFNFPAWGLWEKAAPALLSGVPVVVKPATATAWLTQRMVRDVMAANVLPAGALSIICGSSAGLLDALQPFDVMSFTGSSETAAIVRSHGAVTRHSVRVNIEADSINSAWLLPDAGAAAIDLLAKEVAKEVTQKSGQKCTAIRRILVPDAQYDAVAQAIGARLAKTTVGNPRNDSVRMGALVNRTQLDAARYGLEQLRAQTEVLHDGGKSTLIDADPAIACCMGPTLLGTRTPDSADRVHDTEVFGPVATLIAYRDHDHALALIRRGQGSLVASLYGDDPADLARAALALADSHGRVHVVSADVGAAHTGHGNVMPQSLHGGPGRAGGGEELGGLRALNFYHRRAAIQASVPVLTTLGG